MGWIIPRNSAKYWKIKGKTKRKISDLYRPPDPKNFAQGQLEHPKSGKRKISLKYPSFDCILFKKLLNHNVLRMPNDILC